MSDLPPSGTTAPTPTHADPLRTVADAPPGDPGPAAPASAGRCRLLGEIARGGMGAVLRGHDPDLDRELAVKVLLPEHRDRPDLVRRFLAEARICGRLQHPGVVPVHEVGVLDDRRPFFTMKLVQGRTLAELLRERPAPAADLPRFLGIFEQMCQTVAFAHSRGVIHRDLKPSNVMVGEFGEVQVMDWGLAKARDDAAAAAVSAPAAAEGASQAGLVLGTPAYMAPEQARGEVDKLDARCDVFGLGALLCEILTGAPPYTSKQSWEILLLARQADLAAALARLGACGADADLVRLAKACLAVDPAERPADAGAVAQAVAAHLAGVRERLRAAEVGRAAAQAKAAAERRARRLTVGLAAAVLLLAAAVGVGVVWRQRQQAEAVQAVETALAEAKVLQEQARWADAREAAARAERLLGDGGPDELRRRVHQARADADMLARLEDARLPQAREHNRLIDVGRVAAAYAEAFRAYGIDLDALGDEEAAERIHRSAIRDHLTAALDDYCSFKIREDKAAALRLIDVARRADPDPWRNEVRDATRRGNLEALKALAGRPEVADLPVPTVVLLAADLRAAKAADLGAAVLRAAQRRRPDDFWLNNEMGLCLEESRPEEAVGYFRAALSARPHNAQVRLNLGRVLRRQLGRAADAEAEYRAAVELHPEDDFIHYCLGVALLDQQKWAAAEDAFRNALERDPAFPLAHNNLGAALYPQGKRVEAEAEFRKALELDKNCAEAHGNLGALLRARGERDRAEEECRESVKLNPTFFSGQFNLGLVLLDRGQLKDAEAALTEAVKLRKDDADALTHLGIAIAMQERDAGALPFLRRAVELRPDSAEAQVNLGNALLNLHDLKEAEAASRKAVALDRDLPQAQAGLGLVLKEEGRFVEALACLRRAGEHPPDNPAWRRDHADWLRETAALVEHDAVLAPVLAGAACPADAEQGLALAALCNTYKHRYAATARLYDDILRQWPGLGDDLSTPCRYNAACAAALAGCGRGDDAATLADAERARWRRRAVDWLRADLNLWAEALKGDDAKARAAAQEALGFWKRDADLAGLRDGEALSALPRPERERCRALWDDVDDFLRQAAPPK
jgi:eukaryotic-like serine/threonine-protein kinase